MINLSIIKFPHSIFSKSLSNFTRFDKETKIIQAEFIKFFNSVEAIGLGANMVGIEKRVIIIGKMQEFEKPSVMFNPKIDFYSEETDMQEESSLSFPEISLKIKRSLSIKYIYQDKDGNFFQDSAQNLVARVIQHEIDYLNGITILDRVSTLKKRMALEKIKKIRKRFNSLP